MHLRPSLGVPRVCMQRMCEWVDSACGTESGGHEVTRAPLAHVMLSPDTNVAIPALWQSHSSHPLHLAVSIAISISISILCGARQPRLAVSIAVRSLKVKGTSGLKTRPLQETQLRTPRDAINGPNPSRIRPRTAPPPPLSHTPHTLHSPTLCLNGHLH
jgi:hypothetical protein